MRGVPELRLLQSLLVVILAVCRLLGGRCRPLFCLSFFLISETIHTVIFEGVISRLTGGASPGLRHGGDSYFL
jgi:hypothetical protein